MKERPSKNVVFMGVAEVVASRSRCERKVGAVIVSADNRIIGTGYNGPPSGYLPAADDGASTCRGYCARLQRDRRQDYSDCPALHAELNALLYSDQSARRGGSIYITTAPCLGCAKAIANSGLNKVFWNHTPEKEHRSPMESARFLERCGLWVFEMTEEEA